MSTRRIIACLKGIATGDAVGKQTENLSFADVRRWYAHGLSGFEGPPGTPIPRCIGKRYEWRIGETTDDTERTLAVARAILRDGEANHTSIGRELLTCRKSVHPGVRSLWEFHEADDPARVTDRHDGCGAAIRAAPVGILYGATRVDDIVAAAREASISTHGGALAIAAAASVAAAVSAAIDGLSPIEGLQIARRAASAAESERIGSASTTFATAIDDIHHSLSERGDLRPADIAAEYFPDRPLTIVPLALAIATISHSSEAAILLATNIGGDSDSVASIAGGIAAARYPDTVNPGWDAVVQAVNGLELVAIGEALASLRR